MNVIAGILIGIGNDTWAGRLIAPFFWGIIFVFYQWIFGKIQAGRRGIFVEYMTATTTSLGVAIVVGLIRSLFRIGG